MYMCIVYNSMCNADMDMDAAHVFGPMHGMCIWMYVCMWVFGGGGGGGVIYTHIYIYTYIYIYLSYTFARYVYTYLIYVYMHHTLLHTQTNAS